MRDEMTLDEAVSELEKSAYATGKSNLAKAVQYAIAVLEALKAGES